MMALVFDSLERVEVMEGHFDRALQACNEFLSVVVSIEPKWGRCCLSKV